MALIDKLASRSMTVQRKLYKQLMTPRVLQTMAEKGGIYRQLSSVIQQTLLTGTYEPCIGQIESLRDDLANSPVQTVEVTDFGALTETTTEANPTGIKRVRNLRDLAQNVSKSQLWGTLLFYLLREFKPSNALEMGTCVGISAAYQACALQMNGHGRLITIEGADALAQIAQQNLEGLGLSNVQVYAGSFQEQLPNVFSQTPYFDYVFIDGHHDEHATYEYFEQLIPHLNDQALVVFDDIHWSDGMKRVWQRLIQHQNLPIAVDLFNVGVCVFSKSASPSHDYFKVAIS